MEKIQRLGDQVEFVAFITSNAVEMNGLRHAEIGLGVGRNTVIGPTFLADGPGLGIRKNAPKTKRGCVARIPDRSASTEL